MSNTIRNDIVGQKFNHLLVMEEVTHGRRARVRCQCDCGQEKIILKQNVVNGTSKGCGCQNIKVIPNGSVFNRWTVIDRVKDGYWKYMCRCSCGTKRLVDAVTLQNGASKSCGCHAFEVKSLPTGEAMFNRTLDNYKHLAAKRGISFDLDKEEARVLFSGDCHYCGQPPSSVTQGHKLRTGVFIYNGIDRQDSSKGYQTDNCVSCCAVCNRRKRILTVADFHDWVGRVLVGPHPAIVTDTLTDIQIRRLVVVYRRSAKLRSLPFTLDLDQCRMMLQSTCHYCGAPPSNQAKNHGTVAIYTGIDRIDNALGYVEGNCVPCCHQCNWGKGTRTSEDLIAWAANVVAHAIITSD